MAVAGTLEMVQATAQFFADLDSSFELVEEDFDLEQALPEQVNKPPTL